MRLRIRVIIIIAVLTITAFIISGLGSEDKVKAPEFPKDLTWLNSKPLTLQQLQGKIVLLDFWTYCCINCMHIIPDLKKLENKYKDELAVIGVHSAKYDNEKDTGNIREAILRYEVKHPVINDKDFKVWHEYVARAWPTLVLIDPEGYVVGTKSGEGVYAAFDQAIDALIREYDAKGMINRTALNTVLEKSDSTRLFSFPGKIAADAKSGRLFITDSNHNRIIVTNLSGEISVIIGDGREGLVDDDFSTARFYRPQGICYDPSSDDLYIADTENHAIRKLDLKSGRVTTIAGTGDQAGWGSAGGMGSETELSSPWDLVLVDSKLYIAMAGSHQLWTLDLGTLRIEVFAGSGTEDIIDGPRREAALAQPSGITTDGKTLYFADSEVSAVRQVGANANSRIETQIGEGLFEFGDIDGSYPKARLQHPLGVAYHDGYIYVADTYNHKIKKLDPRSKKIETLIGTGARGYADGPAKSAKLNEPNGLAFAEDRMYITDTNNHAIRVFDMGSDLVSTVNIVEKAQAGVKDEEFPGEIFKLPGKEISPETKKISVAFDLARTLKFVAEASPRVEALSANPEILSIDSTENKDPNKPFVFDIKARPGKTDLTINYRLFCCNSGPGAVCFYKEGRLEIPITVKDGGDEVISIKHVIDE